jgi:hypothetical protein
MTGIDYSGRETEKKIRLTICGTAVDQRCLKLWNIQYSQRDKLTNSCQAVWKLAEQ